MSIIKNFKTNYLLKHIQKTAPGIRRERAGQKFNRIHSIGVVVDGSRPDFIDFAKKYADDMRLAGKSIELLAYVPKQDKNRSYTLPFFTNEDVNWFFKPVTGTITTFMATSFDILVNFSPEKIMPLEYICAMSTAKFVIGNGTDHVNNYYDCLIKVNDSYSPSSFMENVHHYLNLQS